MNEELFSMDMPDLQGLIKQMNMFDKEQNKAVRKALHKIGQNVKQAQQRKIRNIKKGGNELADAISVSKVYTTKKGVLGITSGYQAGAFKTDNDGFNPGVVGVMHEFGRPGNSTAHHRNTPKMKQVRKRIQGRTDYNSWKGRKNWGDAIPTEVEISKGTIQPTPHIRAGFDDTLEQNVQIMIDAVNNVTDKLGEET